MTEKKKLESITLCFLSEADLPSPERLAAFEQELDKLFVAAGGNPGSVKLVEARKITREEYDRLAALPGAIRVAPAPPQ